MNKISLALTTATVIAAAAAAGSARAAEDTYFGASIGQSRVDLNCAASASCDRTSDRSGKIYFGKNLTDVWGAEAFAYRIGKASGNVGSPIGTQPGSVKADGLGLAGTARAQWGDFGLKARLGAAYEHGRTSYALGGSDSKNSLVPLIGVGASYSLNKQWALNLDWDRTRSKFSGQEKADTDLYSLGASYRF